MAVVAVLELTASEHAELLDFQVDVLVSSRMGFALHELANVFGVPVQRVGVTVYQACLDLDKLERKRAWRDPSEVVDSPNVAALYHVCRARVGRVQGLTRRRRLEGKLRKLDKAYDWARSKAMVEAFVGLPRGKREAAGANR